MEQPRNSPPLMYRRVLACLLAIWFLVSCSATQDLPVDAQRAVKDAAQNYYTSPWLGNTHFESLTGIEIKHAWHAKDLENSTSRGEMWCVDISVSGTPAGSIEKISAMWIVVRENTSTDWLAVALETISASSTIERCGK